MAASDYSRWEKFALCKLIDPPIELHVVQTVKLHVVQTVKLHVVQTVKSLPNVGIYHCNVRYCRDVTGHFQNVSVIYKSLVRIAD